MKTTEENLSDIVRLYSKKQAMYQELLFTNHSLVKKRARLDLDSDSSVYNSIDLFNNHKDSLVYSVVSSSNDSIRSNIVSNDFYDACVYNKNGVWCIDINKSLLYIKQVLKNDVIKNDISLCVFFKDEKSGYELSLEINYSVDEREEAFGIIQCNYLKKGKITNLIDYKTNYSNVDYNSGDEVSVVKLTKDRPRLEF